MRTNRGGESLTEMEMYDDMDVEVLVVTGRKKPAAGEDAAGLDKERRREEDELRGKAPKCNSFEDETREDLCPEVRELLHKGNMLRIRNAATRARSARFREELARLYPKAGIPK